MGMCIYFHYILECLLNNLFDITPAGRCNGIINEKNYDYIYIILYSICFMFTKTDSI